MKLFPLARQGVLTITDPALFANETRFPWCLIRWDGSAFHVTTSEGSTSYPWPAGQAGELLVSASDFAKPAPASVWVVVTPSGINPHRLCLLGEGASRKDAIADAYGPGGKLPRHADCYAVTPDEAQTLREGVNL